MRFRMVTVALLIVACGSTVALAQGRGGRGGRGGPGGGANALALLGIDAVQKELELLDDQVAQIQEVAEKLRGQGQGPGGNRPNFQDMTDEERQQFMEERRKQAEEMATKAKEELKNILLDDQMARLQQIYIQVAGTQALSDADVAAKLGLTADQKSKVDAARQAAQNEMRGQMRELFQSGDRDAAMAKMAELRKAADEKVLATLTAAQQKDFEAMKGVAFEMPEGALFGGPGGPGGPGGNRARGGNRPQRPQ